MQLRYLGNVQTSPSAGRRKALGYLPAIRRAAESLRRPARPAPHAPRTACSPPCPVLRERAGALCVDERAREDPHRYRGGDDGDREQHDCVRLPAAVLKSARRSRRTRTVVGIARPIGWSHSGRSEIGNSAPETKVIANTSRPAIVPPRLNTTVAAAPRMPIGANAMLAVSSIAATPGQSVSRSGGRARRRRSRGTRQLAPCERERERGGP